MHSCGRSPRPLLTLTWDNLQRKGWVGPDICTLCSNAEEGICHIFLEYEYTKEVWRLNRGICGEATPNSISDILEYCKRKNTNNIDRSFNRAIIWGI